MDCAPHNAPTITVYRKYNPEALHGPCMVLGDCITFIPEFSLIWGDTSLAPRSGDVCSIQDRDDGTVLIKQIIFHRGIWLMLSSYHVQPLLKRHEVLAPVVMVADLGARVSMDDVCASQIVKAEMQTALADLEERFPGFVRRQGDLVKGMVGHGRVWPGPPWERSRAELATPESVAALITSMVDSAPLSAGSP